MIKKIYSHSYENFFEIWYAKTTSSPLITIELWIECGSVNEKYEFEYGIFHFIEHLMFKGNKEIKIGDLDTIFYLIGGKTNAYTSKDFTVYTFSFQSHYYPYIIPLISNLFCNPYFDPTEIEKEKNIVLEEIRMYEDDSFSALLDAAFLNSCSKENYLHPILGTKESVKNFTIAQVNSFYAQYYTSSRMKLFITGSISFKKIKDIIDKSSFITLINDDDKNTNIQIEKKKITPKKTKRVNVLFSNTLNEHILLLYKLPICLLKDINAFKALNLILGGSRDSLLYQQLHINENLVHDIKTFFHGMKRDTYLFIYFNPITMKNLSLITTRIYRIIEDYINQRYDTQSNFEKIRNILNFDQVSLTEENYDDFFSTFGPFIFEKKANLLKKKDFNFSKIKTRMYKISTSLKNQNITLTALLPHHYREIINAKNILEICNDKNDFSIKSSKEKNIITYTENEEQINNDEKEITNSNQIKEFIKNIIKNNKKRLNYQKKIMGKFTFLKKKRLPNFIPIKAYEKEILPNNLHLIFTHNEKSSSTENIVTIILSLQVNHTYDEFPYLGGLAILFEWLREGTKNYPGMSFIQEIEYHGIEFGTQTGIVEIKCLSSFYHKAIDLLYDYLTAPEFDEERFIKICERTKIEIKNFMDDLDTSSLQYAREKVYKNHGYGKNPSGSIRTISELTPHYVKDLFRKYITPQNTCLIIGGNITQTDKDYTKEIFLSWKGARIFPITYPKIPPITYSQKEIVITNKNQTLLVWGGISVRKYSNEYYHLLLADQLLSGSLTNSMYSLLFQIREQTGFFYDIGGSLVSGCGKEPGLIIIKGLTSKENTSLAYQYIESLIEHLPSMIGESDLYLAKQALLQNMTEKNTTITSISYTILQMERYNISLEKMKKNYDYIKKISLPEVIETVKKFFDKNKLYQITFTKK